jgi:ferredoxin
MKKVWIAPGCIACGTCEFIAPEVFKVADRSEIKPDADLNSHKEKIQKAAQSCPVSVIQFEESSV